MISPDQTPIGATDQRIIELLQTDGRRTYGDIGNRVGLSAPAVKRRMDRLVERGVIVGFTAIVNHDLLGRPLEAFAELRVLGNTGVDDIASLGADIPEVLGVFTLAGDPDALAWLRVRDVHDLKRVIDRLRRTGKVTGTKTMMVLGGTSARRSPTHDRPPTNLDGPSPSSTR